MFVKKSTKTKEKKTKKQITVFIENFLNLKQEIFKGLVIAVLGALLTALFAVYLINREPFRFVHFFGGLDEIDRLNERLYNPVYFFENITEGKYIRIGDTRPRGRITWTNDDNMMLKMNLNAHRIIFNRTLRIPFKSIIDVNAYASARYNPKEKDGKFGMVLTRISIEGNITALSNFPFSGAVVCPLYTSVSHSKILKKGEYQLIVESLFFGGVDEHKAAMQLKLTRHTDTDITIKEYDTYLKKKQQPVIKGNNN